MPLAEKKGTFEQLTSHKLVMLILLNVVEIFSVLGKLTHTLEIEQNDDRISFQDRPAALSSRPT